MERLRSSSNNGRGAQIHPAFSASLNRTQVQLKKIPSKDLVWKAISRKSYLVSCSACSHTERNALESHPLSSLTRNQVNQSALFKIEFNSLIEAARSGNWLKAEGLRGDDRLTRETESIVACYPLLLALYNPLFLLHLFACNSLYPSFSLP